MSELIIVRHGQASFGAGDYDILSDRGKEQSVLAAKYLLKTGLSFDRIYSGTLNRQVDTAMIALNLMQEHTGKVQPLIKHPGLNEYQFGGIMAHHLPLIVEEDASLKTHLENLYSNRKSFQLLFDLAINRWLAEDASTDKYESWNQFKQRVDNTIGQIVAENDRNSRILIFSSGGVISTALHIATGMSPYDSIRTGWGLVNTSFTKFKYGSLGLILHSFNSYPHLEGYNSTDFITYR